MISQKILQKESLNIIEIASPPLFVVFRFLAIIKKFEAIRSLAPALRSVPFLAIIKKFAAIHSLAQQTTDVNEKPVSDHKCSKPVIPIEKDEQLY